MRNLIKARDSSPAAECQIKLSFFDTYHSTFAAILKTQVRKISSLKKWGKRRFLGGCRM